MSRSGTQPAPQKPTAFKSRYKLQGMIGSVVVMWLDYALLYHALTVNDSGLLAAGMTVMVAAAGAAYYFS